jgi:hypothetical protein
MQESRSGPKPRGPFEDKRKTLTTRITEETRAMLEAGAAASGRSLSQEIELQLERALAGEKDLGGPRIAALLRSLVNTICLSGAGGTSDQWLDDPGRRSAVFRLMKQRLDRTHVEMATKEQNTLENILGQISLAAIDDQDFARELAMLHYKHIWHLRSEGERKRYCEAVERITGVSAKDLETSL